MLTIGVLNVQRCKRPCYVEHLDKVKLLTESPLLLIVCAFMTNRNGVRWHPLFLWANVWEEFLLRYIPLLFLDRNGKNSILLGCLFAIYYGFSEDFTYLFMTGTLYAFAERKYSFIEMVIYRVLFTVWIYD